MSDQPLSRKERAARNDAAILEAARTVFLRNPAAPVPAVAAEAGVGISALYRRYEGRDALVRTLCTNGLREFIRIAEAALTAHDPWTGYAEFVRGIVRSDVHALTVRLAGTFEPTPEMHELAGVADAAARRVHDRAAGAGALRDNIAANDLPMVFEQLTAIRLDDQERTAELRNRYTELHLDAVRARGRRRPVPGTPPTDAELGARWRRP